MESRELIWLCSSAPDFKGRGNTPALPQCVTCSLPMALDGSMHRAAWPVCPAISALRAASSPEALLMRSRVIENRKRGKIPKRCSSAAWPCWLFRSRCCITPLPSKIWDDGWRAFWKRLLGLSALDRRTNQATSNECSAAPKRAIILLE